MSTTRSCGGIITLKRRIRELEIELSCAQERSLSVHNRHKHSELYYNELQLMRELRNQLHMTSMVKNLHEKIKLCKDQLIEAERIAAHNLAKYRDIQQQLEEAERRSRLAEHQLAAFHRNSMDR